MGGGGYNNARKSCRDGFYLCSYPVVKSADYKSLKTCPCNIQKIFGCKNENFRWKSVDIFSYFAQNIDCGARRF